ncbi:hypothetical protein [Amycolatopsis viridis]|uniref:Helix-hairpin-helix domain-containing protein n=1 Tax=Amycolatopsis viridis TaxID=185678 RepID=A0ABX0SU07_9PSEU|nr:hypothetical protein [Amycolatopsis viridis]NIH80348.1 hypothetical protein [Amycolatopsis viridis]
MTTVAQLRKAAAYLPEAVEDGGVFTVAGKPFAALAEGRRAHLHLCAADAAEVVAACPSAERVTGGVRIPLADITGQQLNHWVRRAWLAQAPERLARQAGAAETAAAGAVGDLPAGIGRPATRALTAAGITTLDQVAERTEDELLALHGVGPRAIRILRETLAESGRSLAG